MGNDLVTLGTTFCECFQGTPQGLWFSWSIVSFPRYRGTAGM